MTKPVLILVSLVIAWFVVAEAATEGWYRWHETKADPSPPWSVTWPDDPASSWKVADFQEFPIADNIQEILRHDRMRGARWFDPKSQAVWNVNFIEWEPDKNLNGINAVHNPTICLPSAGMQLVETLGKRTITVDGTPVDFQCFRFEINGRSLFVFSAANQELKLGVAEMEGAAEGRANRLEPVEAGNRQGPGQVLHIYLMGPRNFVDAVSALETGLNDLLALDGSHRELAQG